MTNPAAREWYCAKLTALLDLGVDCFKVSCGLICCLDIDLRALRLTSANAFRMHPSCSTMGPTPMKMHNTYSVVYNEMVFDLLRQRFGAGEAVVFARAATVGGQR